MPFEKKRILITVKTIPHPSSWHGEIVCTAGVLEDGTLVRLYPVNFRYLVGDQQYHKYQWIEVDIQKSPDPRKESFKPRNESIRIIGETISSSNNWEQRGRYVLAQSTNSMEELGVLEESEKRSLGIVRPKSITDFTYEEAPAEWSDKVKEGLKQHDLFRDIRKPLRKMPWTFRYHFTCDDERCKGHKISIIDWEISEFYFRMFDKEKDKKVAAQKVKEKFFYQMCSSERDTHFYVGTMLKHQKSWLILGVYWPKRDQQPKLF
ncbi:hypothetical protein K8R78_01485 [bacterium]|nr:hypothetical protein [bacterium]